MLDLTKQTDTAPAMDQPYDARDLTYASSFPSPFKRAIIHSIELVSGRLRLLRLVRAYERDPDKDPDFWKSVLQALGITVVTPAAQISQIPATGPLVIVANHPHGLVDGIVMARLVSEVRKDFKILTRSLLCNVPRIADNLLPVSFAHEPGAIQNNIQTRRLAIEHLKAGGCIALFPSGTVATSDSFFGPATESDWLPFSAKMIRQSGAQVLPVYFPGQNSRLFQIANKLSTTLRQSFLLHEIVYAMNKDQAPTVGQVVDADTVKSFEKDARGLMAYLKEVTYSLKKPA
jgi:putative hemolysin